MDLEHGTRIGLKNVLYLTDFSDASESALPVARGIARAYGSNIHVMHVLLPDTYSSISMEMAPALADATESAAKDRLRAVQSELCDLAVKGYLARDTSAWSAAQQCISDHQIDLIVVGTSSRTGASKLLLGSVAEEIFRRSPVPVLTVNRCARNDNWSDGQLKRVLFATDFTTGSKAAIPYALSLAEEGDAELHLLHVIPPNREHKRTQPKLSVAEAMHLLDTTLPSEAKLWCRPKLIVEHGQPAERILEIAKRCAADLIILGVRGTHHPVAASHLAGGVAHRVVANAPCPVLTVRG